jgi:hypothetical protein
MKAVGAWRGACKEIIMSEKKDAPLHQEGREVISLSTFNLKK